MKYLVGVVKRHLPMLIAIFIGSCAGTGIARMIDRPVLKSGTELECTLDEGTLYCTVINCESEDGSCG